MRAPVNPERVEALKVVERFENALPMRSGRGPKTGERRTGVGRLPSTFAGIRVGRILPRILLRCTPRRLPALSVAELPELALVVYLLAFALAGGVVVAFVRAG